jgi:hypothetical protein
MNAAFDNKKRAVKHTRSKGPKPGEARPNSTGSKYAKKGKNRKRPVPQLKRGEPVFTYFVAGTDIKATKVPCERTAEDRAERRWSQSTLGTWRDPRNNRKCKVERVRNKPVLEVADGA